MQHILVVDDDVEITTLLTEYLARFGHAAHAACDAASMRAQMLAHPIGLVVLDVMLPGTDGITLARELRERSRVPIIMLTARANPYDCVLGLEMGADDYMGKPFEPRELVARIQTVLRRRKPNGNGHAAAPGATSMLKFEGLEVDVARRTVRRSGQEVELTGTEFELLLMLAREPGRVFSRDDILNHLRGHEADLYTRAVDIVVSRLRKKLEPLDCIKTLRNAGYSLALGREGE